MMIDSCIQNQIRQAIKALQQGDVIVFPTETVYGVGADSTNYEAIDKLFKIKHRPKDNPVTLHVSDINMVTHVGIVNEYARKLIDDFWPGALTLILNVKAESIAPNVNAGRKTVGFRMPDNEISALLISKFGHPVAGTSANISGKLSSTSLSQVSEYFKDKISAYIDGGPSKIGIESTVIDLTKNIPTIIRPGSIDKQQIEESLGIEIEEKSSEISKKYKHYSVDKCSVSATADEIIASQQFLNKNKFGVIARNSIIKNLTNEFVGRSIALSEGIDEAMSQLYRSMT
jgi:L-threonylcarbamoyladenylate synthase